MKSLMQQQSDTEKTVKGLRLPCYHGNNNQHRLGVAAARKCSRQYSVCNHRVVRPAALTVSDIIHLYRRKKKSPHHHPKPVWKPEERLK